MPPKASVDIVCWDLGHNAFGRAHLLAELLSASHDVEIVGSHFREFGNELWSPLRDTSVPVRRYAGARFPEYFETMERMAEESTADIVYVVKPRLPALGVGFLTKCDTGRPLIVDCDDLELAFVSSETPIGLGALERLQDHPDFLRPEGRIWTSFCDWAVRFSDAVTVPNVPLAARYGGSVIPHARDEAVFDPTLYDRDEERARLGLGPADRLVMFGGTPRPHKGVHRMAAALESIGDRRIHLGVLATPELDRLRPSLAGLDRWIHPIAPQPFSRLPQLLSAADAACVLQDPASPVARWQTPAKVTDALAMAVPCLVTPTPPLLPLIDEGALLAVGDDDLTEQVGSLLADPTHRVEQARRGRAVFTWRFSYAAVRPQLEHVVEQAASLRRPPAADVMATVSFQRSVFRQPAEAAATTGSGEREEVEAAVRELVLPGGGPIAVVSRGDEGLTRFDSHEGWHFPAGEGGRYAGYYPADSDDAIRCLEDVRRAGAGYLLVPASSAWWFDHYVGFRDHVVTNYRLVRAGNGLALVDLRPRDGDSLVGQGARG